MAVPSPTPVKGSTGRGTTSGDYSHFRSGMTQDEINAVSAKRKMQEITEKQIKAMQKSVIEKQDQLEELQNTATSLGIKFSVKENDLVKDTVVDLRKQAEDLQKKMVYLQNEITKHNKLTNKGTQDAIKSNIQSDKKLGILTEKKGFKFLWFKITPDTIVFNSAKFATCYGGELKFGDISTRYGLKKGALKKANNLRIEAYQMKAGKGDDLNQYFPNELGYNKLNIPDIYV